MSSPPKEKIETKGGHLPAVKAGGMRIVQKHQGAAPPETPPIKDEDEDFVEEPSPPKPTVVVSGVVTKAATGSLALPPVFPCIPQHACRLRQGLYLSGSNPSRSMYPPTCLQALYLSGSPPVWPCILQHACRLLQALNKAW
uniref:Death-associated protein 1 n=1 Tax=Oncorhynchus tshawytscha TaxID=74940 RepID=A0AAZ3P992_ONCTS